MVRRVLFYTVIAVLLIFMALGAIGCNSPEPPQQEATDSQEVPPPPISPPPDQVTFNLNWLPEDPAYWAALDKGFWAKQNLDVTIIRGYGSADAVTKMATKKAEFGMADIGTVILARAREDVKVKTIANYQTYFPAIVIYNPDSGIKQPKDLEGKTIVSSANSAWRLFFPAFAQATGIDQNKVQWKLVDPSLQETTFIRGEADALLSDLESVPILEELTGKSVNYFSYKDDAGLDRYCQAVIIHEDLMTENPDLIRRFVVGFLQGVQYCLENPLEAGEIVRKYVPEIDANLTVKNWQVGIENNIYVSAEYREKGLGWISRERMAKTIELVLDAYDLENNITPEMIYTTEFLPVEPVYPPQQ